MGLPPNVWRFQSHSKLVLYAQMAILCTSTTIPQRISIWYMKRLLAEGHDYTFHSSQHNSYSSIDMILVDKILLQAVSSSTIHDILWSDHGHTSISIVKEHSPNPTYIWRVNSQVFNSPQYVADITKHLQEYFQLNLHSVLNPFTLWCTHKTFMRGIFIQLCG